jgi:zinc/manganese transport system permease protein
VTAPAIGPFTWNLVADLGELLGYDFMRHAVLAGTAVAVAAGLVGYFVVLRNQVFTSDALGHVAFTVGLGGLLLGLPLLAGVYAGTVGAALGVGSLGGRARGRDVAIGTLFAWVLGLGVLFLTLYTTGQSTSNGVLGISVLFGSIFGLQTAQTVVATGAGILTSIVLLSVCRPLLFSSIDPDVAAARGVPVRVVTAVFLVLMAVTVAESVQAVGALLIFALMVTPPAIAQKVTARPYAGLALSSALATAFVWAGLALAFWTPLPVSFCITGLAFLGLALALLVEHVVPRVSALARQRTALSAGPAPD